MARFRARVFGLALLGLLATIAAKGFLVLTY